MQLDFQVLSPTLACKQYEVRALDRPNSNLKIPNYSICNFFHKKKREPTKIIVLRIRLFTALFRPFWRHGESLDVTLSSIRYYFWCPLDVVVVVIVAPGFRDAIRCCTTKSLIKRVLHNIVRMAVKFIRKFPPRSTCMCDFFIDRCHPPQLDVSKYVVRNDFKFVPSSLQMMFPVVFERNARRFAGKRRKSGIFVGVSERREQASNFPTPITKHGSDS